MILQPKRTELNETVYTTTGVRVDRESKVIRSVRVVGLESANGYDYSPKALRDAINRYEGTVVNLDHADRAKPGAERKLLEGFGVLKNVSYQDSSTSPGLYADLHYLDSHPGKEPVLEWAERFPDKFGCSHNAVGAVRKRIKGKPIVEEIQQVRSVDLVRTPATTKGLFESHQYEKEPVMAKITDFVSTKYPKTGTDVCKGLIDAGLLTADHMIEDDETLSVVECLESAVYQSLMDKKVRDPKVLHEAADIVATLEGRLEGTYKAPEKKTPTKAPVAAPQLPDVTVQLKDITESLASLQRKDTIRDVLDSFGMKLGDLDADRRKLLESQNDPDTMRTLIQSWPAAVRAKSRSDRGHRALFETYQTNLGSDDTIPRGKDFIKAIS